MTERIRIKRVATIVGLSPRSVLKIAPTIPSAARIGKMWTFREEAVRDWVRTKELQTCRETSIGVARLGGHAFNVAEKNYVEAYERHLRPKRPSASSSSKQS